MKLQMKEQHQFSRSDRSLVGKVRLIDADLQDLSTYAGMLRLMGNYYKWSQARHTNEPNSCSKRILTW